MFRIKRTKGDATHYATHLAATGIVTGWSLDPEQARPITEGEVARVKARLAALGTERRQRAGLIAFEPVSEAEIKAALDQKQAQESAELVRVIELAVAPLRERLQHLEAQVQELKKPAPVPPPAAAEKANDRKPSLTHK